MTTQGTRHATLGLLWAIHGVFMIALALWIVFISGTLTVMWGAIITRVPNPFAWMSAFHFYLAAAVAIALMSAVFSLLASFALMGGGGSARTLGLTAAAFGLIGTPLGIALGAFTVAILLPIPERNSMS
jgi:hypothetical protein